MLAQGVEVAVLVGHHDHLVGGARPVREIGDGEVAIDFLHGGERLAGRAVGIGDVGDVGVDRAALDHVERPVAAAGRDSGRRALGLLVALAGAEHVAQPQDQEERDAGKDYDLDHLRAHRPNLPLFRPRRWRPMVVVPM